MWSFSLCLNSPSPFTYKTTVIEFNTHLISRMISILIYYTLIKASGIPNYICKDRFPNNFMSQVPKVRTWPCHFWGIIQSITWGSAVKNSRMKSLGRGRRRSLKKSLSCSFKRRGNPGSGGAIEAKASKYVKKRMWSDWVNIALLWTAIKKIHAKRREQCLFSTQVLLLFALLLNRKVLIF